MNSQSEAIVVVEKQTDQNEVRNNQNPETPDEDPHPLNIQFCNSKSIELFGLNPVGVEVSPEKKNISLKLLNVPQFVPLDRNAETKHIFE